MKPFSVVASLVLGLFVLMIYLLFFRTVGEGERNLVDSQICDASVKNAAFGKLEAFSIQDELKCPTLFIELNEAQTANKNVVFKTAALAMTDTWNEFQQGKNDLFPTSTQNYCVIRRVIEFDGAYQHKGFFDYLVTHNPPTVRNTYFNYLTHLEATSEITSQIQSDSFKNNDVIDTSKPIAAVFVFSQKASSGRIESAATGLLIGTAGTLLIATGFGAPVGLALFAGAGAAGAAGTSVGYWLGPDTSASWQASMMLVPYTEEGLKNLECTKLPSTITRAPQ